MLRLVELRAEQVLSHPDKGPRLTGRDPTVAALELR